MSTFQQNHPNGFSPVLLSPSSTNHPTTTTATINNHLGLFDNSDQGSVDSDYTSLGSSKFYGNGGSSSSLHRQGRSQSIDELACTTTIPTRHFNGTSNVNKSTNDPLQFVKIHPNHDLIERAQEQLTLFESRKRLQENFKLLNLNHNNINSPNPTKIHTDDDADWSKAVENWRQKREQKRKQSLTSTRTEDDSPISKSNIEPSPPPSPLKKFDESRTKPTLPSSPVASISSTTTTAVSTAQLIIPNRTASKSPSPQRIRGPAKIHEIFIKRPVDIRGFGFKLDGGPTQNRPISISTIEDGSPADKAGLCVDDEIISMNDENIEQMTFDQVRKILKERNLRGSIKLLVKTYEDVIDDNSQTITTGPTTERSRTPSPQKPSLNQHTSPSSTTTTQTIQLSSTIPSNGHAPVYTFLPYTPPPSSSTTSAIPETDPMKNTSIQQTSAPAVNIFAPKPFRSTASINLDPQKNEPNTTHSSPIEAFRKMLDPSNSIHKNTTNETPSPVEQQSSIALKPTPRDTTVNPLPSNPISISSNLTNPSSPLTNKPKLSPPPLTSVDVLLHGTSLINSHDQQRNESSLNQVHLSIDNQLQQDFQLDFPHTQTSRDQRLVNIPVDLSHASISPSKQSQDTNYINNSSHQPRISPSYPKRSVQDVPPSIPTIVNRPPSSDRTVNELRVNLSSPTSNPQQKKVLSQSNEKNVQQIIANKQIPPLINPIQKKNHYEDQSGINYDQRKPIVLSPSSQIPPYTNGQSQVPHQLAMFHYGDHFDESSYRPSRNPQQQPRDLNPPIHRHQQSKNRIKSPIRTTINSNNNRVLSVSGKLHCSRCNDELGQGSAMVIESLGLYYHIECFRCFVCNIPLSSSFEGTDVRVRSNRLHCQNCFSDENGEWKSNV